MGRKVIIKDEKELRKAVHRDNYLIIMILLVFATVDFDMFSKNPVFVAIKDTSLQVMIVVFQIIFVITLFIWERRKKKIIHVLLSGEVVNGEIIDSVPVRSKARVMHYIQVLTYKVNGQDYTIHSKSKKGKKGDTHIIIYESNNPENSIVLEHLKKNVQRLVSY